MAKRKMRSLGSPSVEHRNRAAVEARHAKNSAIQTGKFARAGNCGWALNALLVTKGAAARYEAEKSASTSHPRVTAGSSVARTLSAKAEKEFRLHCVVTKR